MAEIYGGYFLAVFCSSTIPPQISLFYAISDPTQNKKYRVK
uniref:Uncharacterized protein n=1 Tax=Zymomonas mobilis subsp. mobilis (strain ATCC 31821 / ZM4 / CP4) TaxID=264203 RepID=Q8GF35_ZYMMO|nr:unknown [Zymomonas mobilis subsp. mobilis ZM4 = ATCC 31821]